MWVNTRGDWSTGTWGILAKVGQNINQVVSGKVIWQVKYQCLEDFSGGFHKKMKPFLQTSLQHFCQTNLIQVMSFLNSSFFQKSTGCHAVVVKSLFSRQKIERKYLFRQFFFHGFQSSKILDSFNTRFWSSQIVHAKRYFQKLNIPSSSGLFPRVHFTRENVLNNKHLEIYSSYRKVLWMSIDIPTYDDLYNKEYVWLEQST